MNWNRIEGNWKQFKGNIQQQWGKLTDDEFVMIAGRRAHLAGKIQEIYGINKEDAERQLADWQKRQKHMTGSDSRVTNSRVTNSRVTNPN